MQSFFLSIRLAARTITCSFVRRRMLRAKFDLARPSRPVPAGPPETVADDSPSPFVSMLRPVEIAPLGR